MNNYNASVSRENSCKLKIRKQKPVISRTIKFMFIRWMCMNFKRLRFPKQTIQKMLIFYKLARFCRIYQVNKLLTHVRMDCKLWMYSNLATFACQNLKNALHVSLTLTPVFSIWKFTAHKQKSLKLSNF